ncbi:hypothetical protein GCM10009661_68670 [Catellatospora chokoriensis]
MTRSGWRHDSSMRTPARSDRYSGRERPACRMNHTGVCGTDCPRHARTNAEPAVRPVGLVSVTLLITAIVPPVR